MEKVLLKAEVGRNQFLGIYAFLSSSVELNQLRE